jgi:5-methylcytosine-specific restriction endonuclease McrA
MQLTVDHLRPRNSGGTDEPDNLVAACHSCNSVTSRMTCQRPRGRTSSYRNAPECARGRRYSMSTG